ncbi:MAG: isoprenyl transferase [Candidatus Glassbacteria bacterium]|nr:isoprenyl transferase [Candidatus Glassbacteria bacterium]
MKKMDESELKRQVIENGNIPRHVAIIMDGNGRWAQKRGRPRVFGHQQGMKSVRAVVEACRELGCEVLTLYAFSEENWSRPLTEIKALMRLLQNYIEKEKQNLRSNGIRVGCIGRLEKLSDAPRNAITDAVRFTADQKQMLLNLAVSYGSRAEIVDAVRRLAGEVAAGRLAPAEINETTLAGALYTADLPDPDLLIRTSGEMRLSNFLLWQVAYTEIYITDVLWPDFRKQNLFEAVAAFQKRERRFGKVEKSGRNNRKPKDKP